MEIKVRNVCPVAVSKVDRLAKEKGLSRQAFLKEQIETLSIMEEVKKQEQAIDDLYDRAIDTIQRCSDAMTNMDRTFNKLFEEDEEVSYRMSLTLLQQKGPRIYIPHQQQRNVSHFSLVFDCT